MELLSKEWKFGMIWTRMKAKMEAKKLNDNNTHYFDRIIILADKFFYYRDNKTHGNSAYVVFVENHYIIGLKPR